MKFHLSCSAILAGLLASGSSVFGALTLTGSGYTQDFDSLANASDGNSYNAVTSSYPLPAGWGVLGATHYTVDDGDRTDSVYYSYGTGTSTDRAFGHRGLTGKTVGISFENQTGGVINDLYIVYWGEQWHRSAGDAADRWYFQFSTTATALNDHSEFATINPLSFSSLNLTSLPSGAIAVDGNAPANRTLVSGTITGLNIPVGGVFWIRWDGYDKPGGNEDGLAIDDLYLGITPIPETSTSALVGTFGLLACTMVRRRIGRRSR